MSRSVAELRNSVRPKNPGAQRQEGAMTAKKVIVAVHGIGEQIQFATIQQVLAQFSRYYGQTAAVPLGSFHSGSKSGVFTSDDPPEMSGFGFAEVYWADIPR